jgi:hypothetical protein
LISQDPLSKGRDPAAKQHQIVTGPRQNTGAANARPTPTMLYGLLVWKRAAGGAAMTDERFR